MNNDIYEFIFYMYKCTIQLKSHKIFRDIKIKKRYLHISKKKIHANFDSKVTSE